MKEVIRMTAKGVVVVAATERGSVKLRPVLDPELLDPFSHGGYQPEPAGPVSDYIIETPVGSLTARRIVEP